MFQVLTPMFDRVESVIVYLISDFPSLLTFRQIHLQHTIIMAVHRGRYEASYGLLRTTARQNL